MSRVFLSHSSRDSRQAVAVKKWLIEQEPGLAEEIFLDLDPHTGIHPGERWKKALKQAANRCEAVICLLSADWEASHECTAEFRYAETLNKTVVCGRLEPLPDTGITSEWQRCDLFVGDGPVTEVRVDDGPPVRLATDGLRRLLDALRALGIGAEFFPWPPDDDPQRAPYRGWAALEEADAAVFFGRDAQIVRGLDELRRMRSSGVESLFVILGPSGSGKSSFLRAGLLPRLRRDDRRFMPLDIVRPERAVLTGELGLAQAVHRLRAGLGLHEPALGEIKNACHPQGVPQLRGWLEAARDEAQKRLLDAPADQPAPTLVLPLDQAEELFNADAGAEAPQFRQILAGLLSHEAGITPGLIVAVTIRADRYEPLQVAPELAGVQSTVFDELKPLPAAQFTQVITGPAKRASAAGRRLTVEPALVDRLLADSSEGADALPLLALTLERLYCDYGDDGDLTVAEYEEIGGMAQVVQTEVDKLLAADPQQRQTQLDILHGAFIPWLATINPDNDQPMRRLARYADLPTASHDLIDALVDKRLLVKGTRNGHVIVEVALESLLRQWRELAAWLRAEARDLKDADALERAAADWHASGCNRAWLLEGTRLQEAETLAAKPGFRDRLDPIRDYLQASRGRENQRIAAEKQHQQAQLQAAQALAAAETAAKEEAQHHATVLRKRSRILRVVLAVTAVVAVVAVSGFLLAFRAQNQANTRAREATALLLVDQAQSMIGGQRPGGEIRALQQVLAAYALAPKLVEVSVADIVMARRSVRKVLENPSGPHGIPPVKSVAISPDGHRIASGNRDSRVRVWDADTGAQLYELKVGDQYPAWAVAFSPDGKWIASASGQRVLQIWDANTGEKIGAPMKHSEAVHSLAFSGDSQRIVTGSDDGAVRVWQAATSKEVLTPAGPQEGSHVVRGVAFNRVGDLIVSGGDDGFVRLWDATSGQRLAEAPAGKQVLGVAFSPSGDRVVVGWMGGIQIYDTRTLQPLGDAFATQAGAINSIAFSPDGTRIVSGGTDDTVSVWDADSHKQIGDPLTGHQGDVTSVAFSPDGSRIVSGGDDGDVREWDVVTGLPIPGGQGPIRAVAYSGDDRQIASGGDDGTVRLWDARTAKPTDRPLGEPSPGGENSVTSVAFSPDNSHIVSGGKDGVVRVWDLTTRQMTVLPRLDPPRPLPPDKYPSRLFGEPRVVKSVAFSPDGARIVSGSNDGAIRVWDAHTLKPTGVVSADYPIWSVAFLNEQQVLTGSGGYDSSIQLWDLATLTANGAPVAGGQGVQVFSVTTSFDGQRFASGTYDGMVRVWDTRTRQQITQLSGDPNPVLSVAFSHNGRWIVAGNSDNTLRLWDATTYQPIGGPLQGHQGSVTSVTFDLHDTRVLSGSTDQTMQLWPPPTNFTEVLCSKVNGEMTSQQWNEWVSPHIGHRKVCPPRR